MKTRAIKFAALAALNSLRREVRALLRKRRDARAAAFAHADFDNAKRAQRA